MIRNSTSKNSERMVASPLTAAAGQRIMREHLPRVASWWLTRGSAVSCLLVYGICIALALVANATLLPMREATSAAFAESQGTPAEEVDTVDLILNVNRLTQKMVIIKGADLDCVDDIRCFLRAPHPFDYVITVGFSALSPQDRCKLFLYRRPEGASLRIIGRLRGDIVDALAVVGASDCKEGRY